MSVFEKFPFLATEIARETEEPIIGLQYIEEFLTKTNQDQNEPRYTCNLCAVTGEIAPMWTHIIGSRHRLKYMEMILGMKVDKSEVFEFAQEVERNEGRNTSLITRTICDEKYPMPASQKNKQENKVSLAFTDPNSPVKKLLEAIVSHV